MPDVILESRTDAGSLTPMKIEARRSARKVALTYVIAAGLWITCSDELLKTLVPNSETRVELFILKGWGFALLTGGLLYLLLRRSSKRWAREVEQREFAEAARAAGMVSDINARKLADADLRDSRQVLQLTLDSLSAHIAILDGEGAIIKVNAAWQNFARENGAPSSGGVGSNYLSVCRSASGPASEEATEMAGGISDVLLGKKDEFRLEYPCHSPREQRWFMVRATQFVSNRAACVVVAHENITARKKVEAALRDNERLLSTVINLVPHFIFAKDRQSRHVFANQACAAANGLTPEQMVGRTQLDIMSDPVQAAAFMRDDQEVIASGKPKHIAEETFTNAAGQTRILQTTKLPFPDTGAAGPALVGVAVDITELKQAEHQLRASEERYRQLFDLESDAIVLVDCATHRFIDANQSAQRLYGLSREEFLQTTAENLSAEPEKTRVTVGSGFTRVPLRWHRKKGGAVFPVEITANIIDHRGRRTELTAIRDITERQQALKRFQETNAQLLEAQYIARLGSYIFDVTTGLWTSSEGLDELLGIGDPHFVHDQAGWLQIVHPNDRENMRRYLRDQVLEAKVKFDRAYRIIRLSDQKERWVRGMGRLVLNEQGRVVQMVGVIQDITDQKRAEEQMNLQASALTATANAIVICSRDGKIKWVNSAFTTLTGYSAEEAIGSYPRVLKSGQHPPAFYATLWATVLTGNVWHGELINRRKNQELYTEEMTITPVRDADGQIAHFVAVKQDITERRHLESHLQQAQKMEAIGTLAGGIAHDFNNILAAIFGFGYLLTENNELDASAQESVAEILGAANRAKDLVQQILTFSRKHEQNRQVIRLNLVIKEALKFLRASLPANIQIERNLADDAPAVLADPTQIYQITINLATNALHAMETRPGQLTVSLDSFVPPEKFLQVHPEFSPGTYARLIVADTGMGMDAKTLARIFEPFFTTKPVGKGTGLGLAVVHGIVQSHEGFIIVESEPGRGTTFSVYFPARMQVMKRTDTDVRQSPRGRGERILLTDDEPPLTKALGHILLRMGYNVTASNEARETLKLFREHPDNYDVIISDLTMPEMNGLELARQLRLIRPEVPVILLSGYNSGITEENLRQAGISELLEKPINVPNLAVALQRTIAEANGRAAA